MFWPWPLERGQTNSSALENVEPGSSWRHVRLQVPPKARQKQEAPSELNEQLKAQRNANPGAAL